MAEKPVIQRSRKRVENAKKPAAYWRTTSPRKTLCPRPNAGLSGSMKQNAEEAKRESQRGCRSHYRNSCGTAISRDDSGIGSALEQTERTQRYEHRKLGDNP